jgi:transcriptional regulator with XRE-family HTH domain
MLKKKIITADYSTLAHTLQYRRILKGYSIEELARYSSVSEKTIKRYENGHINIESNQFANIAKVLDITRTTTIWEALGFDVEDTQVWSPGYHLKDDN